MTHAAFIHLIHLVERHGYALLFLWVLAEQGALPVPSVPLLIVVGALVRTGSLNAAAAVACCLAGALLADSVWFQLGRRRGKRVLQFICRVSLEPDSCVRKTETSFYKHGLKTLLVSKFVPGLNAVAAPLAGDSGVGRARFLAVDSVGILFWSTVYMGAGYLFGDQVEDVLASAQRWGTGFVMLVIGLFAAWILWKLVQRRRFLKQLDVDRITPEELRERIVVGDDLYIVDLRGRWEASSTSIDGTIRLAPEDLAANSKEVPRDREVILLCS